MQTFRRNCETCEVQNRHCIIVADLFVLMQQWNLASTQAWQISSFQGYDFAERKERAARVG